MESEDVSKLTATLDKSDKAIQILESKEEHFEDKEVAIENIIITLEEDVNKVISSEETEVMINEGGKDTQSLIKNTGEKVPLKDQNKNDNAHDDINNVNQSTDVINLTETDNATLVSKDIIDIAKNLVDNVITQANEIVEKLATEGEMTEENKGKKEQNEVIVQNSELTTTLENLEKETNTVTNDECSTKKESTKPDADPILLCNADKESEIKDEITSIKLENIEEKDVNANVIDRKEEDDISNPIIVISEENDSKIENKIETIFLTEQIDESPMETAEVNENEKCNDRTNMKETIAIDNIKPVEIHEQVEKEETVSTPSQISVEPEPTLKTNDPKVKTDKTEDKILSTNEKVETTNPEKVDNKESISIESPSEKPSDYVNNTKPTIPKVEITSPTKIEELSNKMKADNILDPQQEAPRRKKQIKENGKKEEEALTEAQLPKLVIAPVQEVTEKEDNADSASRVTSMYIPDWQPPKQNVFQYLCGCFLKPSGST